MDVSGSVIDPSGTVVDVSGSAIDPSGTVVDVSGSAIDPSGTVIDPSGTVIDPSGTVIDPSGTVMPPTSIFLSDLSGGTPPPPRILLSDLMGQLSVLQQQEANDRSALAALTTPNLEDIRNKMIPWIAGNMNGLCDLVRVAVTPPNVCSDGVSRNFFDYLVFLSGKTIVEHLKVYQDLLPEFEVGYRCSRTDIVFCVVRLMA
jgi:hypothetical protein